MPHVALYRKYRSQTFEDLVGQDHITKTLQAGIASGRIAHAYLFTGPRGTGKTSAARILAKSLNCESGPTPTPCGTCRLCVAITSGNGGDVIELDAASESGVDEVRNIIEAAQYTPMEGRYKVYVIDEVHDLSSKAFDALLKTVEEPPPHVVFILATTEFNKVPLTIRSRCQRYDFHRGSVSNLVGRLEHVCNSENMQYEPAALAAIARMADGGYRDALTLLEQAALVTEGNLTYDAVMQQLGLIDEQEADRIIQAAASSDTDELLKAANVAVLAGKEPRAILESLLLRLTDITHALAGLEEAGADPTRFAAMHALAQQIGAARLLRFREILAEAHKDIRDVGLPRLWLEIALLRLCGPAPARQAAQATQEAVNAAQKPEDKRPVRRKEPAPPATGPITGSESDYWRETVSRLSAKYRATGKMLEYTIVCRTDGSNVHIAFTHRVQLERVNANPKGMELIQRTFHEVAANDSYRLHYELRPAAASVDAAVQLPAEGEELAQLVEQVFDVRPE